MAQPQHGERELEPPWIKFPHYAKGSIRWRMGDGERWFSKWLDFIKSLPVDTKSRLAYLQRFAPAPMNWWKLVHDTLYPQTPLRDGAAVQGRDELLELGVIASDASYQIWRTHRYATFPLEAFAPVPEELPAWRSRALWFWSRYHKEQRLRQDVELPGLPESWRRCEDAWRDGRVDAPDPSHGALLICQMLCAGEVEPPWVLGMERRKPSKRCEPSISSKWHAVSEMDYLWMFQQWARYCFDDWPQVQNYMRTFPPPSDWSEWFETYCLTSHVLDMRV